VEQLTALGVDVLICEHIIYQFLFAQCVLYAECFVYLQQGQKMLAQGIGGKYWIRIALLFRKHYIMFMVSEQNVVYVWVKK